MKNYRVTHNGYKVESFQAMDEAEKYIFGVLEEHKDLNPKEIYRGYNDNNHKDGIDNKDTIKSVLIFQYSTLYTEVFMIEELGF